MSPRNRPTTPRAGFDPVKAVDRALTSMTKRRDLAGTQLQQLEHAVEALRTRRQQLLEGTEQLPLDLPKSSRKLSPELAHHIRRLRATHKWSHRELGEQFGVSHRTIGNILAGKHYPERAS